MAVTCIGIDDFLDTAKRCPVLDVRSPDEYAHAHIPGAVSFPLFTDEQRKIIGTAYKQESRAAAIKIGLDAFGPNMRQMVEHAEAICKKYKHQKILVHCWRGGMRSNAVAWLLDLYGFEVSLLEGGYKSYRQWVIAHWKAPVRYNIVAGGTGTGKTEILQALQKMNVAVLDLESIAKHKGSAFGSLPNEPQPTQEMFENLLAERLNKLSGLFPGTTIWVEDESQRIGNINLPSDFYKTLEASPRVFISVPFEQRLERIVSEYGNMETEKLIANILRIKKRLGPLETKSAVSFLLEGNIKEAFHILLKYYDKRYYPAGKEQPVTFDGAGKTAAQIAVLLNDQYHD